MNKLLALTLILGLAPAASANPFEDFKNQTQNGVLKPFAKDFGALIGASDFHSGKVPKLGGFDVGVYAGIQAKPDDDNLVLKNAGVKAFGLPLARAEVGLPLGFSVFARGVGAQGASLIGGGVRYGVLRPGTLNPMPNVAVSVAYDKLKHDILDLKHFSASVSASYKLPIVEPFIGFGYDSTKITVSAAQNPLLTELSATATGTRLTGGVNLTLLPFTYFYGAATLANGNVVYTLGLGARFGGLI